MKNITTTLSAVVKHVGIDKTKTLVWLETYTNSGRSTSSRFYTYDRSTDKWTYPLDEAEIEVSERYVAEDFMNKNGVREISEEEAFNQLVKAYKDSYTVEDLVHANMEAIKKGWCNNGR